jgi:3',5'-cyclic AMP phosphodiesterase CpdA
MKILQISDLHFGDHNQELLEDFLQFSKTLNPELILISGDITQRAKKNQFKTAKKFLTRLPCQFLAIPGNHDIPLYNLFLRIAAPFARYEKFISQQLEVTYENDTVKILGLNTTNPFNVKQGKFSKKQAELVSNFFYNTNKIGILFFHHNMTAVGEHHSPLIGSEKLMKLAQSLPIHLICTGHLHYHNITLLPTTNSDCIINHAGSLSCYRYRDPYNNFTVIDIEKESILLSSYDYIDKQFIATMSQLYEPNKPNRNEAKSINAFI